MKSNVVPVIDLFAGPGGLGEGFSRHDVGNTRFQIALSIEKDPWAHKTLELRAFFRQFEAGKVPAEYYRYLNGGITRTELFDAYTKEAGRAKKEAWCHELNDDDIDLVRRKAKEALEGFSSDHWVLIGGPPCQAYSVVGRARMKNHKKNFEKDERNYLYQHYLRLVADLKPSVFVMENVKGFLTANVEGERIFEKVLRDLERPGLAVKELDKRLRAPSLCEYDIYSLVRTERTSKDRNGVERKKLKPQEYIIHSERYGIPQRRHRVILMGVRRDLDPRVMLRLDAKQEVTVAEVLDDLPKIRSGITRVSDTAKGWKAAIAEFLSSKAMREVDAKTKAVMRASLQGISLELSRGALRMRSDVEKISRKELRDWYQDSRLEVVCNHESKSHMKSDLWRYFFSTCYAVAHGRSPLLPDYPSALLPEHTNATPENTKFLDRFKVQMGGAASSTVTSHISKDGHFFIHHDPAQCRAWTVREAARVQTFPDNYFFEGNRTEQYKQVGNAVPPLLAYQIAQIVATQLENMSLTARVDNANRDIHLKAS